MKFGYRGYVSFTPKIGSIPRTLTNNGAQMMPFATRISDQKTCCKVEFWTWRQTALQKLHSGVRQSEKLVKREKIQKL